MKQSALTMNAPMRISIAGNAFNTDLRILNA